MPAIVVATSKMNAVFDRHTEALHFTDPSGKTFLSEMPGSRRLTRPPYRENPRLRWNRNSTPARRTPVRKRRISGGFLDIPISPALTQVNSQIAIPFLLSSKGYGLLWHNYGLTDLNPADERVTLTRSSTGKETAADVTTSEGTRRAVQREGAFNGDMDVPRSGR